MRGLLRSVRLSCSRRRCSMPGSDDCSPEETACGKSGARKSMASELSAKDVLLHFRNVPRGTLVSLNNHGGFSGANLWRLETTLGNYCLKAFAAGWRSAADLAWI